MAEEQTLTVEQARKLYRQKRITMFLDLFLLVAWIGLAIYVGSNFQLAKDIQSGELNACHVCQENYGASCKLPNSDITYWSKSEAEAAAEIQSGNIPINISEIENVN